MIGWPIDTGSTFYSGWESVALQHGMLDSPLQIFDAMMESHPPAQGRTSSGPMVMKTDETHTS